MTIAHDLFAETNPAFGTFALIAFCRKYVAEAKANPALALTYLALPVAMSADLDRSFSETNAKTGLLSWLNRYPDIRLDLGARLEASKGMVSSSLRFSLATRALKIAPSGTLALGADAPRATLADSLPDDPKKVIKRAERLGVWMARSGSAASIYSAFGVTP
ncbi:three component ABC system middle component [Rhizobium phaseoli]|uniref:three component ABC system middle component n=1 Tax=Rhizobium phaseoli TaxID=396 RepID=UPI000BE79EB0|nr:three component ABC system middle component [Rhizobium phaseoli]PDS29257.1 hypothetical protein CO650_21730 [Rhizobium phaseoli]